MAYLEISDNSLTGFEQPPVFIAWVQLVILDLTYNRLEGQLSIPPASTEEYQISNNKLSGEISPFFCNLSSLRLLDLSNNLLTGKLPQCFENFRNTLRVLNMSNNQFHGSIPQMCANGSNVRMIDLSHNQFQGRLPQMLANCMMLQVLNLGNNRFSDVFPSCFTGKLPSEFFKNLNAMRVKDAELESLDLSNNKLSGQIPPQLAQLTFLEVFEVSHNHLTGPIPQMNQLSTFDVGSYEGNLGLCGNPLPRKCESSVPPSGLEEEQISKSTLEFHWMTVVPGYDSLGVVTEVVFYSSSQWLLCGKFELCLFGSESPLCHNDDSIALLEFKNSFIIDKLLLEILLHIPEFNPGEENRDCCSWDGVACDTYTGCVVALDLSSSFLHGSINSTSTFFNFKGLTLLIMISTSLKSLLQWVIFQG
ncbi:receptor-like protein 7 [Ziziphus jujuba]|uniref:Receptor-like protein 7 n=1 Tax=Ziziphus jujuba TaxID=326968 RepID=A0ABM4A7M1_ZIZJJ|nr:receptor-like protein 7 [Ziziphus jujuba]